MTTDDDRLSERVAALLGEHRWKDMGVSSVSCECGAICYGDASLTQPPADEAFRRHLADAVTDAILAAGWVSPETLADRVAQARAEGAVEALDEVALRLEQVIDNHRRAGKERPVIASLQPLPELVRNLRATQDGTVGATDSQNPVEDLMEVVKGVQRAADEGRG